MHTDTDVWVNDYTTSTGVHVAGHFRKRRTAADLVAEPSASAPLTPDESPDRLPWLAHPPALPAAAPEGRGPDHTPRAASASHGRRAAAERRYHEARIAAGVAALKHRRGEADAGLGSALQERSAAKAELAALPPQTDPTSLVAPSTSCAGPTPADAPPVPASDRCPDCGQFPAAEHRCPIPEGLPAGSYGELKGDQRVAAMVGDLEQSVKAIMESGQLQRWLNAMASNGLQRWSANNRLLAAVQMLARGKSLEDMHMMGFRQWEGLNRKVNKGAKAVWILAPMTRKVTEEDDLGNLTESRRVVGFKSVPVFDISDTNGDALPDSPLRPPAGTVTPGTLEGLRDRVGPAGYSYEETEIDGCNPTAGTGTLGYTHPASKRIVVDSRLSEAQKASTIAHELGHVHCGHVEDLGQYRQHRGRMETEAEMTAYLVNRSRGMSTSDAHSFSPGYIASWSRGDPKVMHAAMDKATRAYNKIMEGPWPGGSRT